MSIPNTFDIAYYSGSKENQYLHKIGECYLESIDVTYGGDKMTFHTQNEKGELAPLEHLMALNFKELNGHKVTNSRRFLIMYFSNFFLASCMMPLVILISKL